MLQSTGSRGGRWARAVAVIGLAALVPAMALLALAASAAVAPGSPLYQTYAGWVLSAPARAAWNALSPLLLVGGAGLLLALHELTAARSFAAGHVRRSPALSLALAALLAHYVGEHWWCIVGRAWPC